MIKIAFGAQCMTERCSYMFDRKNSSKTYTIHIHEL